MQSKCSFIKNVTACSSSDKFRNVHDEQECHGNTGLFSGMIFLHLWHKKRCKSCGLLHTWQVLLGHIFETTCFGSINSFLGNTQLSQTDHIFAIICGDRSKMFILAPFIHQCRCSLSWMHHLYLSNIPPVSLSHLTSNLYWVQCS